MKPRPRSMVLLAFGVLLLVLIGVGIAHVLCQGRAVGADRLWEMHDDGRVFDGDVVVVRGSPFLDPEYHTLCLLHPDMDLESPCWFGVRIEEFTCELSDGVMNCRPFDPSRVTAFEFRGTLRVRHMGKMTFFDLSNLDFEQSRRLVDDRWEPIPLGVFELPTQGD